MRRWWIEGNGGLKVEEIRFMWWPWDDAYKWNLSRAARSWLSSSWVSSMMLTQCVFCPVLSFLSVWHNVTSTQCFPPRCWHNDFCKIHSSTVLTQCDSCPIRSSSVLTQHKILPSSCFVLKQCRVDSRLVTIDEQFCATVQAVSPVQEIGIS